MNRKAYIATYPLDESKRDLKEIILIEDTFWSPVLSQKWDELVSVRKPGEPMLQGWYRDDNQAVCMATTEQPFPLD